LARSEAAISIVQFDGAALTHLALAPVGAGFRIEEAFTQALEGPLNGAALRVFAEAHEVAAERLYTILPRHQVTVRLLTLPAQDPNEIASMVDLSAGEYAPFPRESLVVRHHVLEELPTGESRVLLVLAQDAVVQQHASLLQDAGLEPLEIFLSTGCLHAAGCFDDSGERYALIHLHPASLEVAVVDRGQLRFSRGVAHDGAWNFDDSHNREALAYEVRDGLSAYRRECEDGLGVDTLYVSAEGNEGSEVADVLQASLGKACLVASLPSTLVENADAVRGACPLAGLGAAMAVTGQAPLAIPLLPASIVRARAMRGVQQHALRAAVLGAILFAALGAWFAQAVLQRTLLIRELQVQIDQLAPSAEGVAAKQRGLQIIARQLDQDGDFLDLLSAVGTAAPAPAFNITRIQYDRDDGMEIWGRARTKDQVLSEFLGNLRSLGEGGLAMLARAHSQYETVGKERNEAIYNYHVSIPALQEEEVDGIAATGR